MKKSCAITIACVLALAGCQCFVKSDPRRELDGFDPRLVHAPQPLFPNISISETKKIVLDQTPIRISRKEHARPDGTVTISWALPAGSAFSFPKKNGIQLGPVPSKDFPRKPDEPVSCDEGAQPAASGDAAKQRTVPSDVAPQRPAATVQQSPTVPGISPFYVTGVVLGQGYQTGRPEIRLCERREGLSKVFSCTFVAPERPTVYKYSVYVCRGNKLFDSYDPYIVGDP
jgi:hypothetical protein